MEAVNDKRMSYAVNKIGEGAVELKDCAVARAREFKDAAVARTSDVVGSAVHTTSDAIEKCCSETDSFVRSKPYQSVLVAVGIGVVAGIFIRSNI